MAGTEKGKTFLGDQEVKHFPSLGARETWYMRRSLHGGQRGRGCQTIISLAIVCLKIIHSLKVESYILFCGNF